MRVHSTAWVARSLLCSAVVALAAGASGGAACAGSIVYVDDDAPAGGNGTSWATAFRFLQDGLAFAAVPQHGVTEVRVAQGVYKPDRSEANPGGTGDIQTSFNLVSGAQHKGGYRGVAGGGDPDDRDVKLFVTTLSGDIDSNDGPPGNFKNHFYNSRHVVRATQTSLETILDGFVITGGFALEDNPLVLAGRSTFIGDTDEDYFGGGMLLFPGEATINDCHFVSNWATYAGGGLAGGPNVVVSNSKFEANGAESAGGAMSLGVGVSRVENCTFVKNIGDWGGAIYTEQWNPSDSQIATISRCRFLSNHGSEVGGVLAGDKCVVRIDNCLFSGNQGGRGCAPSSIYSQCANLAVTNTTFHMNYGDCGEVLDEMCGTVWMQSCVIWQHGPPMECLTYNVNVSYCNMFLCVPKREGSVIGPGMIDADPLFIDADGVDNILGTEDDNLRLRPGSPCIDAADNLSVPPGVTTDLAGRARFVDDPATIDTGNGSPPIVDMGAYEFNPACIADVHSTPDGDGAINIGDLLFIITHWGATGNHSADVTFNGSVGIEDLLAVIAAWGACR